MTDTTSLNTGLTDKLPSVLIFIDPTVSDYQTLIQGVTANAQIEILDPEKSGIDQITETLGKYQGISAVHIVSHGNAGVLELGKDIVDENKLEQSRQQLQQWEKSLAANADILLYGCDVAQGEIGSNFIEKFSQLTGADVAASTDVTGNPAQGGNWTLEKKTGPIEATVPFNPEMLGAYQGILAWTNGQAADVVLGQQDFENKLPVTSNQQLQNPQQIAIDPNTGKLFVADTSNNRVLRFSSLNAALSGSAAEAVLGQSDFSAKTANAGNPTPYEVGMDGPRGLFVDSTGTLWVADSNNNRVLGFNNASTINNGTAANKVLGQLNFASKNTTVDAQRMNGPSSVYVDQGSLWVADQNNNRVLRFDGVAGKPNGAAADVVLGQPDFTTTPPPATTTPTGMNSPSGVYVDNSGILWVVDQLNHRVLRFNNATTLKTGAGANNVLGQGDFTSITNKGLGMNSMDTPSGVFGDVSGNLYVIDKVNNRTLIFNKAASLLDGASASNVLGQVDFKSKVTTPITASTENGPNGVFFDNNKQQLWVGDTNNNRVLRYSLPRTVQVSTPAFSSTTASPSSTNKVLYQINIANTTSDADAFLTGLTLTTGGTYQPSDINNIKLWYSADQQFDSTDIQLGSAITTIPGVAGSVNFNNFQQKIAKSSTGYLLLTADITSNATDGDIINIVAPSLSNFTFDSGTKSGNLGASGNLTIDSKPPVATIPAITPNLRNITVESIPFTFNEPVNGVSIGALTLTLNGNPVSLSGATLSGVGSNYSLNNLTGITGTEGQYKVTLNPNPTIKDVAGNSIAQSASMEWNADFTQPTVTLGTISPNPRNTAVTSIPITFSEPVKGLDMADLKLTRDGQPVDLSTAQLTQLNAAGSSYSLDNIGILTNKNGSYELSLVGNSSGITDNAGNSLTQEVKDTWTAQLTPPTVSVEQGTGQGDPTSTAPINFSVKFSKPVIGFDASKVNLSGTAGASLVSVTGSGSTYNLAVTGMKTKGTVVASIPADVVTDEAGNKNAASTSLDNTVAYDNSYPTVSSISKASPDPSPLGVVDYKVSFSDSVTGVDAADFTLSSNGLTGSSIKAVSGSGKDYTVTLDTGTGSGSIGLSVVDDDSIKNSLGAPLGGEGIGNGNFAGPTYAVNPTQTPTPTDNTPPSAIASNLNSVTTTGGTVYRFSVTYLDNTAVDVATIDNQDILVSGPNGFSTPATLVNVTPSGNGITRVATYQFTPPSGSWRISANGTYTIQLQDKQVGDTLGNLAPATQLGQFSVSIATPNFIQVATPSPSPAPSPTPSPAPSTPTASTPTPSTPTATTPAPAATPEPVPISSPTFGISSPIASPSPTPEPSASPTPEASPSPTPEQISTAKPSDNCICDAIAQPNLNPVNLTTDTILGGQAVQGTSQNDAFFGNITAPNIFDGLDGNDNLIGGLSDDTLLGSAGDDYVDGQEGNDILYGGKGNDIVLGKQGNDILRGDLGDDTLNGGDGNDVLYGGKGNDYLQGGKLNDTLYGNQGNDIVLGGKGDDLLYGDDGDDTLCGGAGSDVLFAGNGNDVLDGGAGDDFLNGETGDDTLVGCEGNDTLYDDSGNNYMVGGSGNDVFIVGLAQSFNVIADFSQTEDLIGLGGGLTFDQLDLVQDSVNTLIKLKSSGQTIASVVGVQPSQLAAESFRVV